MLKNNNQAVILRMAKHSFSSNKRRNQILILAILLSAFLLFTILTVGATWLQMQRLQDIRMKGGDFDAYIYGGFTEEQKQLCETNVEIAQVGTEGIAGCAIRSDYDETLHTILLWADDTTWNQLRKPAVESMEGRYPIQDNEVLATKQALKDCGVENLKVGDRFTLTYADKLGEHTREFTISGMWDGYGEQNAFYVSSSFFEQSGFTLEDSGRGFLYVKFQSPLVTQKVLNQTEESLHLESKQHFIVASISSQSVPILIGLLSLLVITCLSAYLLIYNIMYLSISSNIRYYGLLQTIGMTEKQIHSLVRKQMLLIGAIGIIGGLLSGMALSFVLIPGVVRALGIHQPKIVIAIHPVIFLISIGITSLTIYLGSRRPACLAASVTPMEALGYQPVSVRQQSHRTGGGNLLWRMARQQVGKDKRRTILVIAALGVCLSVFMCMATLVKSQGPRTIVSNFIEEDLVLRNDTMRMSRQNSWKPCITKEFLDQIQTSPGIKEVHALTNAQIVVPWEAGFAEEWMVEFYSVWMEQEYKDVEADYKKHPENYASFLVGIDSTEFAALNAGLKEAINEADFLEGKSCFVYKGGLNLKDSQAVGKNIAYYLDGREDTKYQMTIQGITDQPYYAGLLGITPTLIVSSYFLESIAENPPISKVNIQYEEEYDEKTEVQLMELIQMQNNAKDLSWTSKLEEMKEVTKAQGNMMGIGMGIVLVLSFIGIMNYINTVVGNMQSRQLEIAILESIGMTEEQVKKLFIREGILYAGGSLLLTLVAGLPVTYLLYQSMNYMQIPFAIPVLPMAAAVLIIAVLCMVIPLVAYGSLQRRGALERV